MKNINLLYENQEKLQNLLTDACFDFGSPCLVRIFTSDCLATEAVQIACAVKQVLPQAQIIGAGSGGVIFNGQQYDDRTLVVIEQFERTKIAVHTHTFRAKSAREVAAEIDATIGDSQVALLHLICSSHYRDINAFVEEFNQLNQTTKLVGGLVGEMPEYQINGYVFTENGVVEDGIVTASLSGQLSVYNEVNIAHTPISTCYSLDKCAGSFLEVIEQQQALSWCREQFGFEHIEESDNQQLMAENDSLMRFPMILEGHGGASRFVKYDAEAQKLSFYYSSEADKTLFRIGYISPIACVQECLDICHHMQDTPIESLFCYTCLFRRHYMGNCAEWELRPFAEAGICGVFMMGELAYLNGRNEFLNGTCCFVGVADQQTYIEPDFTVFEDLYKLQDDNQKLISYVLHKQGAAMSKENEHLMQKLLQQQADEQRRLYTDANTGMKNSLRYLQDKPSYNFDKMCVQQIENYDLLVAKLGSEGYYDLIRKVLAEIGQCAAKLPLHDKLFYYMLNEKTIFMVANNEVSDLEFMAVVEDLYSHYQFVKSADGENVLVNRFVVVLHQDDLLDNGLLTLENSKNLQTHFLISDNSKIDNPQLLQEMEMIHILNYAIEENRVIPYFQGIYNNATQRIDRYEALMRIEDAKGNIYAPTDFMSIAKKYHMYGSLSRLMLEQVFDLFGDTTERVSMNISANDINFDEMQRYIFARLDSLKNAGNFVFEVLEDENFEDMNSLKAFIDRARSYGVGVAIDDFGSGYSSFVEIVSIEPEYIKIDIDIVKNAASNPLSQKVLENIAVLGKQLNAQTVAEGVENAQIQEKIAALGICFSQGFYFAEPVPYSELAAVLNQDLSK